MWQPSVGFFLPMLSLTPSCLLGRDLPAQYSLGRTLAPREVKGAPLARTLGQVGGWSTPRAVASNRSTSVSLLGCLTFQGQTHLKGSSHRGLGEEVSLGNLCRRGTGEGGPWPPPATSGPTQGVRDTFIADS